MADHEDNVELRFSGQGIALRRVLEVGDWLLIGSDDAAFITLSEATVSRCHAEIRFDGQCLWLRDIGSRNGSFVAGHRLKSHVAELIPPNVAVVLGEVEMTWRALRAGDAELALAMDGNAARDESRAATATMATQPLDAWTRLALPGLLAHLARGCHRTEFALALAQSWLEHLPVEAIEVIDVSRLSDGDADAPRLFASHPVPMGDHVQSHSSPGLSWRVQWQSAFHPSQFTSLWECVHSMLLLCSDGVAPTTQAPVQSDMVQRSFDPAMQRIYCQAMRAAHGDIHVLIRGESGTGKELLARHIHQHASASDLPFVAVNCAALSEDLLESELFGVESRVATGVDARPGLFERADGGFLFLDEIGDMSLATQARILRVLQEGVVTRVGGSRSRGARVRVISATHKPLTQMVEEGKFRLDLLHRIADWEVQLPPLRERLADIGPLALHFLSRSAAERGVRLRGISRSALDALLFYTWPGNVRELEREMARIAIFLDEGATVTRSDLRISLREATPESATDARLEPQLARAERQIIERTLAQSSGNINAAAEVLGISRATLYRKLGQAESSTS